MSREKALEILKGGTVIPAIPLALNDDGTFNEHGQRVLCRYYLDAGVGGIAIAVHTTQFEIRKPEVNLFEPVLKIASEEIAKFEEKTGKTIVKVSGVCGPIEQATKEAEIAKSYGFDAVLLSPGGLADKDDNYLIERTKAVAKVMPVIGFYLQIACGGRFLNYDYWKQICEIDNVVAIKCASFNRYSTIDVVRAVALSTRNKEIGLYTGNDDNIVVDLLTNYKFEVDGRIVERRFDGGLLGHWSVWTKSVCDMFEKIKGAEINDELLTLAAQITDANAAVFDTANNFEGVIAGVHEVLYRQGLMKSVRCINPDEKLSKGQAEELDRVYKMYPHLNDDAFVKENLDKWEKQ